jgi:fucose 4-O-acetylase-like acetyltransferase
MDLLSDEPARLHYLDWLRVVATLAVFWTHATLPFDPRNWYINNDEQNVVVTSILTFISQFGMPLFFLLAGAGSWFALRRRSSRQFIGERSRRLVVPFFVSAILFQPFQIYYAALHDGYSDWYSGPFLNLEYFRLYFESRLKTFDPEVFTNYGSHLWFVGYLFGFSLMALPLFLWLKKDSGKRLISRLAGLCERRGGILTVILPLAVIRFVLHPLFPRYTSWADFIFMLVFFISGYLLFSDERFPRAIERDANLVLVTGIVGAVLVIALRRTAGPWLSEPGTAGFFFAWTVVSTVAWSWVIIVLNFGMRFLDFRNKRLDFGKEAIMPFYMFHHPAIVVIAFYVVQWNTGILVKLPVIVLGSFAVTLGLTDVTRRIKPLRPLFGMKPSRSEEPKPDTALV